MQELLNREGKKAGLMLKKEKTQVMPNSFTSTDPVLLEENPLQESTEFVYQGRVLAMTNDLIPELQRS